MLRNVGAVIAGMFVGGIANMGFITLSWYFWPMPEGLTMADTEGLQAYIATLPLQALLLVIVAHLSQAFVGGWIAAAFAASRPMMLAMIVGGLTMLGSIMNMFNLDGPAWMWAELPFDLLVAWLGGTLAINRRAPEDG